MAFVPLGVLLALSLAALLGAGLRVGARAGAVGLERVVAAAVVTGAAAVAYALLFGLVGLGSSPVALSLAAGATWLVARLTLPAPEPAPHTELAAWWRGLNRDWRAIVVLAGAAAGYVVVWVLSHPYLSFDSGLYHYPEIASWVQSGHPGSVVTLSYDFPFGNYPLTDEVLQTWAAGIARSWIPIALWPAAGMALFVAAAVSGLRTLGVPRLATGLAVAAIVALPWMARQLNEQLTDLPVLAWTAATAALCAGAPKRPGLLPIALVGAGLALGTKTTPILMIVVVLAVAGWLCRAQLRRLRWPLLAAGGVAVGIGGIWYLRNLFEHGSPLWPFLRLPGSDPIPGIIDLSNDPLLGRVSATLDGRWGDYVGHLAGGLLLLAAAPLAALIVRRRAVVFSAAVTVVGFLLWTRTPGTGIATAKILFIPAGTAISETRYLLPVLAAAAVTLALAYRDGGRVARIGSVVVFAAVIVWNLVEDVQLPSGILPPGSRLVAAALIGGAILIGLSGFLPDLRGFARRHGPPRRVRAVLSGGLGVALVAALLAVVIAPAGKGWVRRGAASSNAPIIGLDVMRWASFDRAMRHNAPIAFAGWAMVGPMAGDRFQHRYELLPSDAPCHVIRNAARKQWIVTTGPGFGKGFIGVAPFNANQCLAGLKPRFDYKMRLYGPPAVR